MGWKDTTNKRQPTLINELKNLIDVQSGGDYRLALCSGLQTLNIEVIWMVIEPRFRIWLYPETDPTLEDDPDSDTET